jgi:hypothetical protein
MAQIPAPSWVNTGAVIAEGLDLLGLRQPVQAIGGSLLDGITSVTPTIRYLSYSCWLLYRYADARLPDSYKEFSAFAQRAEAALVMGNLLANGWIGGLVGPIRSQRRLEESDSEIVSLDPVANTPALGIYLSAAANLGFFRLRDDAVPQLSKERGLPLALAIDQILKSVPFAHRLTSATPPTEATRKDLESLGKAVAMNSVSEREISILGDAVIPEKPSSTEWPRVATYASLFSLTDEFERIPGEFEFMEAATRSKGFQDQRLANWSDAWLAYGIRDMLAVAHECLCFEMLEEINQMGGESQSPIHRASVISALLSRVDDLLDPLVRLGLAAPGENVEKLTFKELVKRVAKATKKKRALRNGLNRWEGDLTETALIEASLTVSGGQVMLVMVAWIMVAQRVSDELEGQNAQLALLSGDEDRRVGVFDVVVNSVNVWSSGESSLIEIGADLMSFTIQQHLNIAWSRMQVDLKKDVALLSVDEGMWKPRGKQIAAGRTVSRLDQAIGWMTQLGWIDEDGISKSGRHFADRALGIVAGVDQ